MPAPKRDVTLYVVLSGLVLYGLVDFAAVLAVGGVGGGSDSDAGYRLGQAMGAWPFTTAGLVTGLVVAAPIVVFIVVRERRRRKPPESVRLPRLY